MSRTICIVFGALLTCSACATMPTTPPPIVKTICVPTVTYSAAQQAAMADELAKLPDTDPLALAMVDYGRERAALRACAKP